MLSKSHRLSKSKKADEAILTVADFEEDGEIGGATVLEKCRRDVSDVLKKVADYYAKTITSFEAEDRKTLKETTKEVNDLSLLSKKMRNDIYKTVRRLQEENIDSSLYYVQVLDYLRETAHCLTFVTNPAWEHLNNNHKPFSTDQLIDLNTLRLKIEDIMKDAVTLIESGDFKEINKVLSAQAEILDFIRGLEKEPA